MAGPEARLQWTTVNLSADIRAPAMISLPLTVRVPSLDAPLFHYDFSFEQGIIKERDERVEQEAAEKRRRQSESEAQRRSSYTAPVVTQQAASEGTGDQEIVRDGSPMDTSGTGQVEDTKPASTSTVEQPVASTAPSTTGQDVGASQPAAGPVATPQFAAVPMETGEGPPAHQVHDVEGACCDDEEPATGVPNTSSTATPNAASPTPANVTAASRLFSSGYSPDVITFGREIYGDDYLKIETFAQNFVQLQQQGHSEVHIKESLLMCDNDLTAARAYLVNLTSS